MIDAEHSEDLSRDDAELALALFAVAPHALGGVVLRTAAGPHRDQMCSNLRALLEDQTKLIRVPLHITDDRLLGGLSLTASLELGRPVAERGVLAAADGGVLVVSMAERLLPSRVAHLCGVLDRGSHRLERDGLSTLMRCRSGVVALDEGRDDEHVSEALRDRLAFHVELSEYACKSVEPNAAVRERVVQARASWRSVEIDAHWLAQLCEAACSLGVASLRAPLLAATAARVHAALAGELRVREQNALVAARLVLGPRATQLPAADEPAASAPDDPAPHAPSPQQDVQDATQPSDRALHDVVVAAAKSGIPRQLLETLWAGRDPRARARAAESGRAGALRAAQGGGRPVGVRAAQPSGLDRLNIVETLRAAAPWQRLRGRRAAENSEVSLQPQAKLVCGSRERSGSLASTQRDLHAEITARQPLPVRPAGIVLRKEDLRVTRYVRRSETTVIFSVDASGSAALQRLSEAKGAVEQLLIDCYARRDHVALFAFRGGAASLLLPPTRSLTRVRRRLAELAGGGATPLAAGIEAAAELALRAKKQGSAPIVVLMSDARGNVARDGGQGSVCGMQDALLAARELRAASITSLFLDTSARPRQHAQHLAAELGARYLPLPYLDATAIAAQVRALSRGA